MNALIETYEKRSGFESLLVDDLFLVNGGSSYTGPTGQNNSNMNGFGVVSGGSANPLPGLSTVVAVAVAVVTRSPGGLLGGAGIATLH